jgi:endogenous inhibitor of DNA gyrase (YacG/DUF329 family)
MIAGSLMLASMYSRESLTAHIKADLLKSARHRDTTPKCFACGREFTPKPSVEDDNTHRFCSQRCRRAYDRGFPRCEELPTATDLVGVDTSHDRQVAGTPIPSCTACGALCVELYKDARGPFCSWRCRDGKPRDCIVCGKSLYNTPRKGPYCSTGCANDLSAKRRKSTPGA